jgi:hypothetical protein
MQPLSQEFIPPEILQKIRDKPDEALSLAFFYKGGKEVVCEIALQKGILTKVYTLSTGMKRAWAQKTYDANFYIHAEVRII